MDGFEKKTLKTSRGYTYTYYTSSGDSSLPALVFHHGWPDHAAMWAGVAGNLKSSKHPIIIPDLLGYDGTDKPTDVNAYVWSGMTADVIEIVDAEQHEKVISIGHDWGSSAASRLYNYYPDRVVGLVNLNVAYTPPNREPFNLDQVNAMTEKIFGYPIFAYWGVSAADDGAQLYNDNVEKLYPVLHGTDTMKTYFTVPNAMREYLTSNTTDGPEIQLRPYAQDPAFKSTFINRMKRDGFEGPQNWYIAATKNIQHESDKLLPAGVDVVKVPALYIGGKDDAVCRPEAMYPSIQAGLLPHIEQGELLDAAHWTPYERPKEVAERIGEWLGKHFKKE